MSRTAHNHKLFLVRVTECLLAASTSDQLWRDIINKSYRVCLYIYYQRQIAFNYDICTGKNNPGINLLFKVSSLRFQFSGNLTFLEQEISGVQEGGIHRDIFALRLTYLPARRQIR